MKRNILIYLAILTTFGAGIFLVIGKGRNLAPPKTEDTQGMVGIPAPMAKDWKRIFPFEKK